MQKNVREPSRPTPIQTLCMVENLENLRPLEFYNAAE